MPRGIVVIVEGLSFITNDNKPSASSKIFWKWPTFTFRECLQKLYVHKI